MPFDPSDLACTHAILFGPLFTLGAFVFGKFGGINGINGIYTLHVHGVRTRQGGPKFSIKAAPPILLKLILKN